MQPMFGFWKFIWVCINAACDATIANLKLDPTKMIIGLIGLGLGFLLFWWKRGRQGAQNKVIEDFLWISLPLLIIVMSVFIFNLFRSPYLIYRAEHEKARQLIQGAETRAQSAELALEQERDRNSPNFELSWTSSVIGDGTMVKDGEKTYYTESYLQVGVLNHGAPSVIKDWKGLIRLADGTELEGTLLVGSERNVHVPVKTKNGRVELPISPSLISQWSNTPIPTGGRGVGSVMFLFPPGQREKMQGGMGALVLKLWDINNKEYRIEIPWKKQELLEPHEIFQLPGMNPSR
jgi:hypothetical protein